MDCRTIKEAPVSVERARAETQRTHATERIEHLGGTAQQAGMLLAILLLARGVGVRRGMNEGARGPPRGGAVAGLSPLINPCALPPFSSPTSS